MLIRYVMQTLIADLWKAAVLAGLIMLLVLQITVNGLLINGEAGVILKEQDVGNMMLILLYVNRSRLVNGATELEVLGVSRIGVLEKPVWA